MMLAMVASYTFAATRGKTKQRDRQVREGGEGRDRERGGGAGREREGEGFYVLDTSVDTLATTRCWK